MNFRHFALRAVLGCAALPVAAQGLGGRHQRGSQ
jgi:hypothetical protein